MNDFDLVDAVQTQAKLLRETYKLAANAPLELVLPLSWVTRLVREHGSLRAAADAFLSPRVSLVCREWRDVQLKVNLMFRVAPAPWRLSRSLDELTRVAVAYGGAKT